MSEFHWPGRGYSPVCKSETKSCERCRRDFADIDLENCFICGPEQSQSVSLKVQIPQLTLEIIKAKHGNVSAYLRGLILKNLGADAMPDASLKRRGGRRLKVNTDL
jgi:hypothetical protein